MSALDRTRNVTRLHSEEFDVVVIGAGMTGTGCALDAASRGLRVALIDAGDIASGTSSKSSKMVHGGLRYLQNREFRLVYENLRERQRLLDNAPHLVSVLPFLIPLFGRDGVVSKSLARGYATALRLYDWTGGWRIGRRFQRVTRAEALGHMPTLRVDSLVAGFLYFDARGDDARVALMLARTAADRFGTCVATYARATGFTHDDHGAVTGVAVRDTLAGDEFTVATRSVVNATGVWADDVFTMAERATSHRITPAKGVHVAVPAERLPCDVAAVLAVPGDRRSIFVVPFEDAHFTYIGTTDTAYDGALDTPTCTAEDVAYLLDAVNRWSTATLTPADVTGVWAGLRPLLAPRAGTSLSERTADLSRRHHVEVNADHVVHVTGGKWTTYRQMAEDTVDAVTRQLGSRARCRTKDLAIAGAPGPTDRPDPDPHLWRRFGTFTADVRALIASAPTLGDPLVPGLPYLIAEAVYAVREEGATTLQDVLTRRTRAHLMDARATAVAAPAVAALVGDELGWDAERRAAEVRDYLSLVDRELAAAGLAPREGS